ncbi:hypothetical protein JKG68_21575 [Microvirga aerilata]|uniref:DUF6894 domain-containing protein n=1 Tax=Microvirga aerilata TaxID=670292 RepID=A0A936ZB07_9HYPH|nr:hypothetical protein [Microvirga aerilata]MBL0406552.1 hypothetical protein [Microvirga aerilata]
MRTYFFNIRDDLGLIEDEDGIELSGEVALWLEAIRSVDEFVRDTSRCSPMRLEVTDSEGRTVLMTPVQASLNTWRYLSNLAVVPLSLH